MKPLKLDAARKITAIILQIIRFINIIVTNESLLIRRFHGHVSINDEDSE